MTAHARDIAAGTRLGSYEVLRKLAIGGMAEIYLARLRGQFEFEKLVVLKTILPNVADDPAFVAMFLDEARLAATLHHPNIAQVHDVGSDNGVCFFAMEFVHGEDARTLRQAAKKAGAPLPLAHALAVIHATASALHYAHDRSIVHRDVSPSNILISYDGAVKLVDFGIARASARQTKTRTGTLKGKIPYMSPEQCRGMPTDRRSDLFSLGVCLHELTVGRRPFHGANASGNDFAILEQIVHGVPTRPSEVIPGFPPALEHIIGRLLAKEPDDRYATGEEMLIDLEAFIADANLRVSPISLGRYMQGLFAQKIAAWQQADSAGVTLGQHVAQTITSESKRSERLITPPSAVSMQVPATATAAMREGKTPRPQPITGQPVPERVAIAAETLVTTRRSSQELAAVVPAPVPERVSLLGVTATKPVAPLKRGNGLPLTIAAIAIGAAGVAVGLYVGQKKTEKTEPAPAATTAPAPTTEPIPTPTPTPTPTVTPTEPTPPPPVVEAGSGSEAGTETETEKPEVTPVVIREPVKEKPARKVRKKKRKTEDPKEDPTWDRDSPFLPQ